MHTIRGRIATTHVHFILAVYQVVTITVCEVVFIVAIGSYRGRKVVRRAASCVRFDSDVFKFVTSRILSKFVQVSCQLRKHVACGHAPVMICVSGNDWPCRLETLSLDKQGLCVRFRRISRRATPYGEAQLLCLRWGLCHVGLVLCSHIVGRANFMCVRFFSEDSTPTIGVPWRRSAMCIDEVLCALAHLFLCQHLGQCQ